MKKLNPLNLLKIELNPSRIFGLDVLRAFAILVVVIGHGESFIPVHLRGYYNYLIYDGVSIFFVLSGFLIGGILIKILEKKPANFSTLWDFWIRRWFRTLPNYFLVLFVLIGLAYSMIPDFNIWNIKSFFWFGQNLYTPHLPFFPEAWSLSIEEWFYLLVPIFIFLCIRIGKIPPRYAILLVAVFVILFVTNFRYIRFLKNPVDQLHLWDVVFRKQVITRLDALMYGIIGAYIAHYMHDKWIKYKGILLILGIALIIVEKYSWWLVPDLGFNLYFCVFIFILPSLGTLFVLPYLSQWRSTKSWLHKPITYISLISYSMYLLNFTVMAMYVVPKTVSIFWPSLSATQYAWVATGLYWLFNVVCSILIYKYFEIPFMKLRDRFKSNNA